MGLPDLPTASKEIVKRSPDPLTQFRVYPSGKTLYYMCVVWPTKRAMCDTVNAGKGLALRGRRNFEAIVCPKTVVNFPKHGHRKTLPILGEIHFHRKSLTMGIISHESGHAALSWCRRLKLNPVDNEAGTEGCMDRDCGEEIFCYALGNIARAIAVGTQKFWPK